MNAIVIEHVPIAELPHAWREKLGPADTVHVTVRIEAENAGESLHEGEVADDPLFGMWRDRDDMADVEGFVRRARASRFDVANARDDS